MSADKYPCIFLKPNGGYCAYYPSNIFSQGLSLVGQAVKNVKIIMLAFKNIYSLFKTISSIQLSNLFETKTELAFNRKQKTIHLFSSYKNFETSVDLNMLEVIVNMF